MISRLLFRGLTILLSVIILFLSPIVDSTDNAWAKPKPEPETQHEKTVAWKKAVLKVVNAFKVKMKQYEKCVDSVNFLNSRPVPKGGSPPNLSVSDICKPPKPPVIPVAPDDKPIRTPPELEVHCVKLPVETPSGIRYVATKSPCNPFGGECPASHTKSGKICVPPSLKCKPGEIRTYGPNGDLSCERHLTLENQCWKQAVSARPMKLFPIDAIKAYYEFCISTEGKGIIIGGKTVYPPPSNVIVNLLSENKDELGIIRTILGNMTYEFTNIVDPDNTTSTALFVSDVNKFNPPTKTEITVGDFGDVGENLTQMEGNEKEMMLPGDIILQINDIWANKTSQMISILQEKNSGDNMNMTVIRGGNIENIILPRGADKDIINIIRPIIVDK